MEKQRYLKMDATMKNMLIQALHRVYRRQKDAGEEAFQATGDLILRLNDAPERRLFLNDQEHKMLLEAVNHLRSEYLAANRCSEYLDNGMLKLMKLRYKRCSVR